MVFTGDNAGADYAQGEHKAGSGYQGLFHGTLHSGDRPVMQDVPEIGCHAADPSCQRFVSFEVLDTGRPPD
jgi:hypothetical protein